MFPLFLKNMQDQTNTSPATSSERIQITSIYLEREVLIDVYLPLHLVPIQGEVSLLLVNDGQDLVKMPFEKILDNLYTQQLLKPLMVVALHCGIDRKMEYGTAYSADFKGRGAKAGLYNKFIFDELLPLIRKTYGIQSFKEKAFAGFSLGALSALDIVWNNAAEFNKVGVFSGSLWWRRKSYDAGYNDETDRLMHLQINNGVYYPWLQFYLQTGALDEAADRNNNGVIDSIDDALDLIVALKAKGYTDAHIHYEELADGRHDVPTWALAFPKFLQWGWGK